MKPIAFLHPGIPDYAGDGLFHGLRTLLGTAVIDYPRMDYMYDDYPTEKWRGVANEGKILYGLLRDNEALKKTRSDLGSLIDNAACIVISQPNGFGREMLQLMKFLMKRGAHKRIVWVDGSDVPALFPFISFRQSFKELLPAFLWPMHRWLYFKREYAGKQQMAPAPIPLFLRQYRIQPFSISIPAKHLSGGSFEEKTKDFPGYLVDRELAELVGGHHGALGQQAFAFTDESSYLDDVSQSRFGITTKRAGWDALRHYEYASKGAILCFRQFDSKPAMCAPHGLHADNCIGYENAADLLQKIASLDLSERIRLSEAARKWATDHTTIAEASRFLKIIEQQPLYLS